MSNGRKIKLPGFKLGKRGLEKVAKDASAKKRQQPGGSKKLTYGRKR